MCVCEFEAVLCVSCLYNYYVGLDEYVCVCVIHHRRGILKC